MRNLFLGAAFLFTITLIPGVCLADLGSEVRGMFDRLGLRARKVGIRPGPIRQGTSRDILHSLPNRDV